MRLEARSHDAERAKPISRVIIDEDLHLYQPSLYCRANAPGDVHLGIIRGTPSCCAEISGEYEACSYDEPNGEPAHVFSPGLIAGFESSIFR
jgi:hypothetical protein